MSKNLYQFDPKHPVGICQSISVCPYRVDTSKKLFQTKSPKPILVRVMRQKYAVFATLSHTATRWSIGGNYEIAFFL